MTARLQDQPFDPAPLSGLSPAMRLHELGCASLGSRGVTMEPAAKLMLETSFGSVERWRDEFMAMGQAIGGGAGWVLLVFQPREGSLVNQCATDHTQVVAGGVPILALARHGQADPMDDGAAESEAAGECAAAGECGDAFMGNIDWTAVYGRYQRAVYAASEPWGASPDEIGDAQVFDVRRAGVFEQARTMIPGARWCDPSAVATWSAELPADCNVLVYCVYGHEVGRVTALRLRAAGVHARFLRGGIDGWQSAQRPLMVKPAGQMP